MRNFTFQNPTRIHFGNGQIAKLANEVAPDDAVLMLYGGGSIKRNGVYEQVMEALGDATVHEAGGVPPNPTVEALAPIIEQARREQPDLVLAVGGGSVLDGAKLVVAAACTDGDAWDLVTGDAAIDDALPLGTVLTLPGTGSEMNANAVISSTERGQKLAFNSPHVYPTFSILDPTTTVSLPKRQTANGVADAFTHVLEQYLTFPANAPLQDRMAESVLCTLIEEGPTAYAEPENYDARANVMWAATMALNGIIGAGVPHDWATHAIGHELTALHGLDHARTLSVVLPSLLWIQKDQKHDKLLHYGARVWGITDGPPDERVRKAIRKTADFYASLDIPTTLSDVAAADADTAAHIVAQFEARGVTALGERGDIDPATVRDILDLSLEGEPVRSLVAG